MSKSQVFLKEPEHSDEIWPILDDMIEDIVEEANPYDALNEVEKNNIARGMREYMLTEFENRKIASREDVYEYLEIDMDDDIEPDFVDDFGFPFGD